MNGGINSNKTDKIVRALPFLKCVAKAYAENNGDLSEYCFLFPNKRSGTFFLKYLKEECGEKPMISPQVTAISDFVENLSGYCVASNIDLLFTLYDAYRNYSSQNSSQTTAKKDCEKDGYEEFELFRRWGETVIGDFNLVDQYMVDPEEIFKNVKDFKEITSNFLTDEQKEIIEKYFGQPATGGSDDFWRDFEKEEGGKSETGKSFYLLWRMLFPLYALYNTKLREKGLISPGGAYREACVNLEEKGKEILPWKKMVVIGFNALSSSEIKLFQLLQDVEAGSDGSFCEFYWDATGPVMKDNDNSASRFVLTNRELFPEPEWSKPYLERSETEELPPITVISAPSNSSQAKVAGNILYDLITKEGNPKLSTADIAVVLPDESLLFPMLYSIPEEIKEVNLTMGFSIRNTSVFTFMQLLKKTYLKMRVSNGVRIFFHEDIRHLLSHFFSNLLFGYTGILRLRSDINKFHKISISEEDLRQNGLENLEIFKMPLKDESWQKCCEYLLNVVEIIRKAISASNIHERLEKSNVEYYQMALLRLVDALHEYDIEMSCSGVMRMTERLVANTRIGLEGEPLAGLQVLGTLETRALDFNRLIVLSMNERKMPMRRHSPSFIPDTLRYAYGLPPTNYSEELFAYYFFRMISRAREVTLIYDGRTSGGDNVGGPSRYLRQLRYIYAKDNIREEDWKFDLSKTEINSQSITKNEIIRGLLDEYFKEGSGHNLSASSLNKFRICEAKFFFNEVLGLDNDPEPSVFINAITTGNILHKTMEELYIPTHKKRGVLLDSPLEISKAFLLNLLADDERISNKVTEKTNEEHFKLSGDDLSRKLTGAARIIGERIVEMVKGIIKYDLSLAPFLLYGTEVKDTLRVKMNDGRQVNFRFAIDRIDKIKNEEGKDQLRIVDYKTGSKHLEIDSLESLYNSGRIGEQIFQLFMYAWLLGKKGIDPADVRLEIYRTGTILKSNHKPLLPSIGGKVTRYGEYSREFDEMTEVLLQKMFDSPDFEMTKDDAQCRYCNFKALCRR